MESTNKIKFEIESTVVEAQTRKGSSTIYQ